jgi:hypothetical protein
MTSLTGKLEVLKQDARGRVRTPVARREALLDEFEKSGMSGAAFARLSGIKYATFAAWAAKRRKGRTALSTTVCPQAHGSTPASSGDPIRLFEAVVDGGGPVDRHLAGSHGLLVELPGGSRMVVESPLQMQMAAELVALIAQRARARC